MAIIDEIKHTLDDASLEAERLAKLTRLNFDLVGMRRQRDAALRELGRQALARLDEGTLDAAALEAAAAAVRDLDRRIADLETEIGRVRSESATVRAVGNVFVRG